MGDYAEQMVKNAAIVQLLQPVSLNGLTNGTPISLKGWDHCTIVINTGAIAVGTAAVTLTQDTSVTATGSVKALAFTTYYTNSGVDAGTLGAVGVSTLFPVVQATTALTLDTANATYVIEVDADTLDVTLGFDTLRPIWSNPGGADLAQVTAILTKGRFVGAAQTIKDVTID